MATAKIIIENMVHWSLDVTFSAVKSQMFLFLLKVPEIQNKTQQWLAAGPRLQPALEALTEFVMTAVWLDWFGFWNPEFPTSWFCNVKHKCRPVIVAWSSAYDRGLFAGETLSSSSLWLRIHSWLQWRLTACQNIEEEMFCKTKTRT